MGTNKGKGFISDKYIITKSNGNPVDPDAKYFVLRLDKDIAALDALRSYIIAIETTNPALYFDLVKLFGDMVTVQRNKFEVKKARMEKLMEQGKNQYEQL